MDIATTQYEALKKFLATHLAREQASGARTNARDKLTRLTKQQFHELSTDVYDELTRRMMDSNEVPFLPLRPEFHPKRNQARQKLATLPKNRFKDLASDVYYELEHRYPELKDMQFPFMQNSPQSQDTLTPPPRRPPAGATSQINNIVPEMGTSMQETIEIDFPIQRPGSRPETSNSPTGGGPSGQGAGSGGSDNDGKPKPNNYPPIPNDMPPEYGTQRSPNSRTQSSASTVSDIGRRYMNGMSVSSVSSSGSRMRDTTASQKSAKNDPVNFASLDSLMADLGSLIDVKKPNGDAPTPGKETGISNNSPAQTEKELEKQIQRNRELSVKLGKLEQDYKELRDEHSLQQETVNDVRKEIVTLLEETRSLSQRNDELMLEKDQDAARIRALTAEVVEWKNKYEKMKISKGASSFIADHPTPDGAIDESKIAEYRERIDNLLNAARSENTSALLSASGSIVEAWKKIMKDVEEYEKHNDAVMTSLKIKLRGTLENLVTVSKNYANGSGVYSDTLDAAASNVGEAVVELVKHVKVRPSEGGKPARKNGLRSPDLDSVANASTNGYSSNTLKGLIEEIVPAIKEVTNHSGQNHEKLNANMTIIASGVEKMIGSRPEEGEQINKLKGSVKKLQTLCKSPRDTEEYQKQLGIVSHEIAKGIMDLARLIGRV